MSFSSSQNIINFKKKQKKSSSTKKEDKRISIKNSKDHTKDEKLKKIGSESQEFEVQTNKFINLSANNKSELDAAKLVASNSSQVKQHVSDPNSDVVSQNVEKLKSLSKNKSSYKDKKKLGRSRSSRLPPPPRDSENNSVVKSVYKRMQDRKSFAYSKWVPNLDSLSAESLKNEEAVRKEEKEVKEDEAIVEKEVGKTEDVEKGEEEVKGEKVKGEEVKKEEVLKGEKEEVTEDEMVMRRETVKPSLKNFKSSGGVNVQKSHEGFSEGVKFSSPMNRVYTTPSVPSRKSISKAIDGATMPYIKSEVIGEKGKRKIKKQRKERPEEHEEMRKNFTTSFMVKSERELMQKFENLSSNKEMESFSDSHTQFTFDDDAEEEVDEKQEDGEEEEEEEEEAIEEFPESYFHLVDQLETEEEEDEDYDYDEFETEEEDEEDEDEEEEEEDWIGTKQESFKGKSVKSREQFEEDDFEDEEMEEEDEEEEDKEETNILDQKTSEDDEESLEKKFYWCERRNELIEYSNQELEKFNQDIKDQMTVLEAETEMFINFCDKVINKSDANVQKTSKTETLNKMQYLAKRLTLNKVVPVQVDYKNVNISHRLEVVESELNWLKKYVKTETTRSSNVINQASFNVIDLSRQLVSLREKRIKFDEIFDSNINIAKLTGKPKDILKFWQEEVQKLETRILKLRLKKVALKLHLSKMQSLTNQAEETNEILSENDINLLKIKNQLLGRKIKEGNENLLVLKITAGKMRLKLNSLKTGLLEAEKVSAQVASKISMANDQADKSYSEINNNGKDLARIKRQIRHIVQYINAYSVPEVIEYARFVEHLPPLERQIKHYGRKMDVRKEDEADTEASRGTDDLEDLQTRLEEQTNQMSMLREMVMQKEAVIQKHEEAYKKLTMDFSKFKLKAKSQLANSNRQLQQQQSDAVSRLSEGSDESSMSEACVGETDAKMRAKVTLLKKQCLMKDARIKEFEEEMEGVRKVVEGKEKVLREKEEECEKLRRDLLNGKEALESEGDDNDALIQKLQSQLDEMVGQMAYKEQKILSLLEEVTEREGALLDLRESLNEKDAVIKGRDQAISILRTSLQEGVRREEGLQATLDKMKWQMDDLQEALNQPSNVATAATTTAATTTAATTIAAASTEAPQAQEEGEGGEEEEEEEVSELKRQHVERLEVMLSSHEEKVACLQDTVEALRRQLSAQEVEVEEERRRCEEVVAELRGREEGGEKLAKFKALAASKIKTLESQVSQLSQENAELSSLRSRVEELEEEKGALQLLLVVKEEEGGSVAKKEEEGGSVAKKEEEGGSVAKKEEEGGSVAKEVCVVSVQQEGGGGGVHEKMEKKVEELKVVRLRGVEEEVVRLRGVEEEVVRLREVEKEVERLREVEEEVVRLRGVEKEVERLREVEEEVVRLRGVEKEVERLREVEEEVVRLRGVEEEVVRLREVKEEGVRLREVEKEVERLREVERELQGVISSYSAGTKRELQQDGEDIGDAPESSSSPPSYDFTSASFPASENVKGEMSKRVCQELKGGGQLEGVEVVEGGVDGREVVDGVDEVEKGVVVGVTQNESLKILEGDQSEKEEVRGRREEELQVEVDELRERYGELREKCEERERELGEREGVIGELSGELEATFARLKSLNDDEKMMRKKVEEKEEEVRVLKARVVEMERQVEVMDGSLKEKNEMLTQSQKEILLSQELLESGRKERGEMEERMEGLKEVLVQAVGGGAPGLGGGFEDLSACVLRLSDETRRSKSLLVEMEKVVARLERECAVVKEEKEEVVRELSLRLEEVEVLERWKRESSVMAEEVEKKGAEEKEHLLALFQEEKESLALQNEELKSLKEKYEREVFTLSEEMKENVREFEEKMKKSAEEAEGLRKELDGLKKLEGDKGEAGVEESSLQERLMSAEREVENLRGEVAQLRQEVVLEKEQEGKCVQALEEKEVLMKKYVAVMRRQKEVIRQQKEEEEEGKKGIVLLQSKLQDLESRVSALNERNEKLTERCEGYGEKESVLRRLQAKLGSVALDALEDKVDCIMGSLDEVQSELVRCRVACKEELEETKKELVCMREGKEEVERQMQVSLEEHRVHAGALEEDLRAEVSAWSSEAEAKEVLWRTAEEKLAAALERTRESVARSDEDASIFAGAKQQLEEENLRLKSEVQDAVASVGRLERVMKETEEKIRIFETENVALKDRIKFLEGDILSRESALREEWEGRTGASEKQIEELKDLISKRQNDFEVKTAELERVSRENDGYKEEIEILKKEKFSLHVSEKKEWEGRMEEKEEWEGRMEEKEEKIRELFGQCEVLRREKENSQVEMQGLEVKVKELEGVVTEAGGKRRVVEEENLVLKGRVEELSGEGVQREELEGRVEAYMREVEGLKDVLSKKEVEMERAVAELEREREIHKREIEVLKGEKSSLQRSLEELRGSLEVKKEEEALLRSADGGKKKEWEGRMEEKEENIRELLGKCELLRREREKTQEVCDGLSEELEKEKGKCGVMEKELDRLALLEKEFENLKMENIALEKDLSKARRRVEEMGERVKLLESSGEMMRKKVREGEEEVRELKKEKTVLSGKEEKMSAQIRRLEGEKEKLVEKRERVVGEGVKKIEELRQQHEEEMEALRGEMRAENERSLSEAEMDRQSAMRELQDLRSQYSLLSSDLSSYEAINADLEASKKQLEKAVERLQVQVASLKEEASENNRRTSGLAEEIFTLSSNLSIQMQENEALKNDLRLLNERLRESEEGRGVQKEMVRKFESVEVERDVEKERLLGAAVTSQSSAEASTSDQEWQERLAGKEQELADFYEQYQALYSQFSTMQEHYTLSQQQMEQLKSELSQQTAASLSTQHQHHHHRDDITPETHKALEATCSRLDLLLHEERSKNHKLQALLQQTNAQQQQQQHLAISMSDDDHSKTPPASDMPYFGSFGPLSSSTLQSWPALKTTMQWFRRKLSRCEQNRISLGTPYRYRLSFFNCIVFYFILVHIFLLRCITS